MPLFQVWYRLPKAKKVDCRFIEADDRKAVQKEIEGLDPRVIIGFIAPLDVPEVEENRDFLTALSGLADAANQLSVAVNEVLRTWPRNPGIPGEMKDTMSRIEKWIESQPGYGVENVKKKLGINWEDLPLTLTVSEVAEVLRIGKNQVYQFCHGSMFEFPSITVGSRILVPREKLREWFEKACDEGSLPVKRSGRKR